MMQLTVQDSGTLGILTLRGTFTRIHAGELRAQLTRGINRANRLIVNCEQVESFDLSCLKLLCSAYRVSYILNKGFILAGGRAALLRGAAGGVEHAECALNGQMCVARCLWTDGASGTAFGENVTEAVFAKDRAAA